MNSHIFTGNYEECKVGNLISISRDKGKDAGFNGKAILDLAPEYELLHTYHMNIGKIPDEANIRYYIEKYYNQVLSKVDIEKLLENEKDPILLCYEKGQEFCHRHVVAEFIEIMYGVKVKDIKIDENLNIEENKRPEIVGRILRDIMEKDLER